MRKRHVEESGGVQLRSSRARHPARACCSSQSAHSAHPAHKHTASRGRGPMTKAVMGSTTEQVLQRAACACLVVKPQVNAGDTYR